MTIIRTRSIKTAPTGVHAKYVGRVGALAVALGIGAALATTPWMAPAKPSDSDAPGPKVTVSTNAEPQEQKGSAPSSPDDTGPGAIANDDNDDNGDTRGATTGVARNDSDANDFESQNAATVDKSIKGEGTGSIRINTATGALTGEESGVNSHLGKYNLQLEGVSTRSPEGTVSSSGTVTIVAANGDELTGTFTLTGNEPTLEAVVTITGGTGRFANASGTLTVICVASGLPGQEEQTLVIKHDCTTDGDLSY